MCRSVTQTLLSDKSPKLTCLIWMLFLGLDFSSFCYQSVKILNYVFVLPPPSHSQGNSLSGGFGMH